MTGLAPLDAAQAAVEQVNPAADPKPSESTAISTSSRP